VFDVDNVAATVNTLITDFNTFPRGYESSGTMFIPSLTKILIPDDDDDVLLGSGAVDRPFRREILSPARYSETLVSTCEYTRRQNPKQHHHHHHHHHHHLQRSQNLKSHMLIQVYNIDVSA
jgi:hypothetical protein